MFWWDWAALRKQLHCPTLQHHQSKNSALLQKHTPLWLAESREGQRPTHINHFSCLLSDCAGAPKGQLGLEGLWESSPKPSPEFSVLNKVSQAKAMSTSHSTNQLLYTVAIFDVWSSLEVFLEWGTKKKHPLDLLFLFLKKKERRKRVMSTPKSPSV